MILSGVEDITSLRNIPLDGAEVSLSEEVKIRVQDSNGMLSLTTLDSEGLRRLIQRLSPMENTAIPVSSLQDWTDADDLTRLNGAETSFYKKEGRSLLPRNYALQYPEEFGFIRGMTPAVYEKIRPGLTFLPTTGFNPNTASDDRLRSTW